MPTIINRPTKDVIVSANSYLDEVNNHPSVNVRAYHSDNLQSLAKDLSRGPRSKPVIISDDGAHLSGSSCAKAQGSVDPECVNEYAKRIKAAGGHYEHLALELDGMIESCKGGDLGIKNFTSREKNTLKVLRKYATRLSPGGFLTVGKTSSGQGTFFWNGNPVTLMGFSVYGSVVSNAVDPVKFLDAIKFGRFMFTRKGCNFTRVWLLDQWAALGVGCSSDPNKPSHGVTPFTGATHTLANHYNLNVLSNEIFDRLKRFVALAWERGIVVQVTLFERNGLYSSPKGSSYGRWKGSPYNAANNTSDGLTISPGSRYPLDFLSLDRSGAGVWHRQLISRVIKELEPYGNVIFEIMNEAEPQAEPDPLWDSKVGQWQVGIAKLLHGELVDPPAPQPPPTPDTRFELGGFTSDSSNHNKEFRMEFDSQKTFRVVTVDFDVAVGPYQADTETKKNTHHCLLWLRKDKPWTDMMIYMNAVRGTSLSSKTISVDSNLGPDNPTEVNPGVLRTGHTYHIKATYDGIKGGVYYTITENGEHIASGTYPRPIGKFTDNIFLVQFGTQISPEGPEAKTYGWKFSNISVEFFS